MTKPFVNFSDLFHETVPLATRSVSVAAVVVTTRCPFDFAAFVTSRTARFWANITVPALSLPSTPLLDLKV